MNDEKNEDKAPILHLTSNGRISMDESQLIVATAVHEAGHALAALKVGCRVHRIAISYDHPGAGLTIHNRIETYNPIYPSKNYLSVLSAHNYAIEQIKKEMKITLAGPVAESIAFGGHPLRSPGSIKDSHECICQIKRIGYLNEIFSDIYPVPKAEGYKILNAVHASTKRWLSQEKTWRAISMLTSGAVQLKELDENMIFRLIGKAGESYNQPSLDFF